MKNFSLTGIECMRLLCAFQALTFPSGRLTRGVTHKKARKIIEDMTGIRLIAGRTPVHPPRLAPNSPSSTHLGSYLQWAVENAHDA